MFKLSDFVIIGVYIYIISNNNNSSIIVLSTVVAICLLCIRSKGGLEPMPYTEGFDLNQYLEESNINKNTLPGKDIPTQKINLPYDGVCLKTGNSDNWMKSPDNSGLIPNDKLYTYLANQIPLKTGLSDQTVLKGPPIDGKKGSPEKMFMWANNVSSPLCCPSTYSTSTGCICSTKGQRDFIAGRGQLVDSDTPVTPGTESEIIVDAQIIPEEI